MPLNFPTSPAVNEKYTFAGRTWIWNGIETNRAAACDAVQAVRWD
jgi:hypothetical protein